MDPPHAIQRHSYDALRSIERATAGVVLTPSFNIAPSRRFISEPGGEDLTAPAACATHIVPIPDPASGLAKSLTGVGGTVEAGAAPFHQDIALNTSAKPNIGMPKHIVFLNPILSSIKSANNKDI